ncbi:hypothetical protein [Streptosporangium saharense]|uniref:Lipoprotein n=1 Tax=Streptosporangium saharense TaxID=1706840 RepID=A0A7W7QNY4_9ACTN|nr:hypothetical protein [Streptosporangium saharense]MBB4916939.1 hypothetical protein [Streptosporangium saharense]
MLVVLGGLGGCARSDSMTDGGSKLTEAQATARVEELIRQVVSGITPKPRMELIPTSLAEHPCIPNEGSALTGEIYVVRSYHLKDLPKDGLSAVAEKIRGNWESAGHKITMTYRFDEGEPRLSGETSDGFGLALDSTVEKELALLVQSPCFRPSTSPSATP